MFRQSISNYSTIVKTIKTTTASTTNRISQKIQGTFIERLIKYLKVVGKDYKDVVVQLRQDARENKLKATVIVSGMGFLGFCMTHNPTEQSFRAKYIQCANDVALVNASVVNPQAVRHLKFIEDCYNKGLIRHTSLLFFSVIWVDKYCNECKLYETICPYTQLPYRKILNNIIDIGFLNFWWVISRKMLDYDINY